MEEIEFYHKNRRYTCNVPQDNSPGVLLIKNHEGAVLELKIIEGQPTTGQKRTKNGNIEQIDLSHPYIQDLISLAQILIQHRKKLEEKKQESIAIEEQKRFEQAIEEQKRLERITEEQKQLERFIEEQKQLEQKKQVEIQHKKQAEEIAQKEKIFVQTVENQFEENIKDLSQRLKIAFLGKVSSGKSSLINAYLGRDRSNILAKVGAEAGVTTESREFLLGKRVKLVDLPGLDDIRAENSKITQNYLNEVDVGILVVTGAADASQKKHFNNLKANCDSVFVVLNKIDEWDKLNPSSLEKVINQWKQTLQIEKIYPCCANGYDPDTRFDAELDVRGVSLLQQDINNFLDTKGKKLLLAHQMPEKRPYAVGIIAGAVALVAGQAILPGRAAFITVTQLGAIASLYYLYTGEILSKGAALAIIPIFAGQAVASSVFLFVTSFIPPTGVIEVAAAITAASITLAMLSAVNFVLESGANIEDKELLKSKFQGYQKQSEALLKGLALTDVKNLKKVDFNEIVNKFL